MAADKVIYGNIVTMNEKQPRAQAMTVRDGKITFVGTKDDAKAYVTKDTEVIDFGAGTVYPGFIDSHSHLGLLSTIIAGGPAFPYGDTYENNVRDMTEYIRENPGKELYKAFGYTPDPGRGAPTRVIVGL